MNNKLSKNLAVFVVLLILIGIAVFQNVSARGKDVLKKDDNEVVDTAPKPGFLAPTFQLTGLDGKSYQVGGKQDKPYMLNFWASWCGPCELEAPDLKNMYDKYKDDFNLYGINTTDKDNLDDMKKFVKQYKLPFPILLDKEGKVADLYRFNLIPTSFLVDRNGVVVDVIHILSPSELERKIKKLIKE
ncbi:TlpA family protein disulfide reductase [Paenibacillus psychroresistens]|uniref:TlpA family protein disulfide reductase n=1 Tax=Paenibacillus psychroresistens TaxID=1778678 RepID=A0A6B8RP20_9BACL|nr:TlpA disulfide reductase family protein [Paenibacillus psychroresistens]QGQ97432.1 TlpA family protein disulfide reductase [Paenibacillus psychroresistens]